MSLEQLLANLGLNIAANVIYDLLKSFAKDTREPTVQALESYLASHLSVDGANIKAAKILEFLAEKGNIVITNSSIEAAKQITMSSSPGSICVFGNNSTSSTMKTAIETKDNAQIRMQGGAKIVQDEDGSIKFYT
ncbi:MAG: hypothetical protein WCP72_09610 [Desulfomonile sp.]